MKSDKSNRGLREEKRAQLVGHEQSPIFFSLVKNKKKAKQFPTSSDKHSSERHKTDQKSPLRVRNQM